MGSGRGALLFMEPVDHGAQLPVLGAGLQARGRAGSSQITYTQCVVAGLSSFAGDGVSGILHRMGLGGAAAQIMGREECLAQSDEVRAACNAIHVYDDFGADSSGVQRAVALGHEHDIPVRRRQLPKPLLKQVIGQSVLSTVVPLGLLAVFAVGTVASGRGLARGAMRLWRAKARNFTKTPNKSVVTIISSALLQSKVVVGAMSDADEAASPAVVPVTPTPVVTEVHTLTFWPLLYVGLLVVGIVTLTLLDWANVKMNEFMAMFAISGLFGGVMTAYNLGTKANLTIAQLWPSLVACILAAILMLCLSRGLAVWHPDAASGQELKVGGDGEVADLGSSESTASDE
jgi:hypothetical protein